MEGEPKIGKEQVLQLIREKGLTPEVVALVMKWREEQEQPLAQDPTRETGLRFEINATDLYNAAGEIETARG